MKIWRPKVIYRNMTIGRAVARGGLPGPRLLAQNLGVLNLMIIAAFMFNFVNKKIHFNKKRLVKRV